jgi:hypothetical protein
MTSTRVVQPVALVHKAYCAPQELRAPSSSASCRLGRPPIFMAQPAQNRPHDDSTGFGKVMAS